MFVLCAKVATNYGVVDTEDGAIDWCTKEQIQAYLAQGLVIKGISDCNGVPTPQTVDLPYTLCNWNNGANIFSTRSDFSVNIDGSFKLRAGKKVYKGKLRRKDNELVLKFSFNIRTVLSASFLDA